LNNLISIILAAHNEEDGITELITSIINAIPIKINYEIFVAEDGSTDRTREVVVELSKKYDCVRISQQSNRLGYSKAIQEAIKEVRGEIVMFIDGDGQSDPYDLLRIMGQLKPEHVVVGYRSPRMDSKARIFQSKLFNIIYRLLRFPKLIDPSSGTVVAFRKDIVDFTNKKLRLEYGFWWEFQAWLGSRGITIIEIPVSHFKRKYGDTKVYLSKKIIKLSFTHVIGLFSLKKDLMLGRDQLVK
jgi:glycosyltransferase involved in cell wall biosynthesis